MVSLEIIIIGIMIEISRENTSKSKAEFTISLSAIGSINFPKVVTKLFFLLDIHLNNLLMKQTKDKKQDKI